jgi:geranylgeranyl pyrophosphate synthase
MQQPVSGKAQPGRRPARLRPVRQGIPATLPERNLLLRLARQYVDEVKPVPPVPLPQIREHASEFLKRHRLDPVYQDYAGVLINNEVWRETLAAVPYEKRLLLLPKCLRLESQCPATFDEFGLLCQGCGMCSIQDLQGEAEKLGYAVMVAEGSAMVTAMIQAGKIEAVVGVSCLNVLERAFPYMEAAAVPGLAIPLLQDDCSDTTVDLEWVWEYIHLTSEDRTRRLDLSALRNEVETWFSAPALETIMGSAEGRTEALARAWLTKAGKRWRPFLVVAAYQALAGGGGQIPESVRKVAMAVECFHKASLIHDDIEDNDAERYGERTMHAEHGLGVALNVGDLLIGEGYRLLGESDFSAEQRALMQQVAAAGQRQLCRGQGAELCWAHSPEPLSSTQVLEIFRQKTAPAFEVALKLGSICGLAGGLDGYEALAGVVHDYSEALGVAYQIRDDREDYATSGELDDLRAMRPGLMMALGYEQASGADQILLESLWRRLIRPAGVDAASLRELFGRLQVDEKALELQESYKERAIESLRRLTNPSLKGLLRRVIGRIFNQTEFPGWCQEYRQEQAT